jgi:hypothetical protein
MAQRPPTSPRRAHPAKRRRAMTTDLSKIRKVSIIAPLDLG